MRKVIDATPDIGHDTKGWSNEKLMAEVAPDAFSGNPEGQFFPTATKSMRAAAICRFTKPPTRRCNAA